MKIKMNKEQEAMAALALLRSTGVHVLEAAQVACAALRAAQGNVTRAMKCVDLGADALKRQSQTVAFEEAAWSSVRAREGRRPTTIRDLRNYVRRLLRVEGVARRPLRAMGIQECRDILKAAFGGSRHSYRKGRAVMHSVFAYGVRQEWCDTNPVSRIEVPEVREQAIEPLTLVEVERLRMAVRDEQFADMKFSLCLLLYSGVRPAEVERIAPDDVCWEERVVIIRPQKSKTGGGRAVPLRGMGEDEQALCVVPRNWQTRWRALRLAAGFSRWRADVCRHTFASYHIGYFRNLQELQLELGHRDASLIRSRYTLPTLRRNAAQFWSGIV